LSRVVKRKLILAVLPADRYLVGELKVQELGESAGFASASSEQAWEVWLPTTPSAGVDAHGTRPHRLRTSVGIALIVVGAIVVLASGRGSGQSAEVRGKVTSVSALDSSVVRLAILWTNHGRTSGSANCTINTTVRDKSGDDVIVEHSSTSTNGKLKPGATRLLYADIGVNNGDARFVTPGDVRITRC